MDTVHAGVAPDGLRVAVKVIHPAQSEDRAFMKPTITFDKRAQTVMVTGGPISTLTDDYKEEFSRAGEMAVSTALAHRLKDSPATWPYGRYYVHWKDFDGQLEPTFLGYGQATGGCFDEIAGQWLGTATERSQVAPRRPTAKMWSPRPPARS